MDPKLIPKMVEMWCGVYVGALVVLAVMSYVSSVAILDGLEWLDRRLTPRVSKPGGLAASGDAPDAFVKTIEVRQDDAPGSRVCQCAVVP